MQAFVRQCQIQNQTLQRMAQTTDIGFPPAGEAQVQLSHLISGHTLVLFCSHGIHLFS